MGFNYAAEKKKFETLWARLRREYRAAGMSDTAIQKMHDFDWEVFKQERIYRLHTQDLGIGIFDEPSAEQEDKSALMKKFLESVSRWDALTSGVDAKTLSGILGHTNASFTLDTYTHVTSDMQKTASGIVGGFMEDIFGKELKPWQENEKPATEP